MVLVESCSQISPHCPFLSVQDCGRSPSILVSIPTDRKKVYRGKLLNARLMPHVYKSTMCNSSESQIESYGQRRRDSLAPERCILVASLAGRVGLLDVNHMLPWGAKTKLSRRCISSPHVEF